MRNGTHRHGSLHDQTSTYARTVGCVITVYAMNDGESLSEFLARHGLRSAYRETALQAAR